MRKASPSNKSALFLIGFMGCGKSAVSREISRTQGLTRLDMDEVIESKERRRIFDIFKQDGEAYFRRLEQDFLDTLVITQPTIISTGGGVVLTPKNQGLMHALGTTIYLQASADTLFDRLQHDAQRPLLQGQDLYPFIKTRLAERDPLYRVFADDIVSVNDRSLSEVVAEVWTIYSSST